MLLRILWYDPHQDSNPSSCITLKFSPISCALASISPKTRSSKGVLPSTRWRSASLNCLKGDNPGPELVDICKREGIGGGENRNAEGVLSVACSKYFTMAFSISQLTEMSFVCPLSDFLDNIPQGSVQGSFKTL